MCIRDRHCTVYISYHLTTICENSVISHAQHDTKETNTLCKYLSPVCRAKNMYTLHVSFLLNLNVVFAEFIILLLLQQPLKRKIPRPRMFRRCGCKALRTTLVLSTNFVILHVLYRGKLCSNSKLSSKPEVIKS